MPAHSLLGLTTHSGWNVIKKLNTPLSSGGNFCIRYLVESSNGEIGFLKAMDFSKVNVSDINELQRVLKEYIFEKEITQKCKDERLSKVIIPLDAGTIDVPNFPPGNNTVHYIIFEKADASIRECHIEESNKKWLPALVAMKHVALGVEQLHRIGIAHQDLKPSNVLKFHDHSYKVADLGRVVDKDGNSPFCKLSYPGDQTYRPVEMNFGYASTDFIFRRSCDMYMIGSLIYNMVFDIPINISNLKEAFLLQADLINKPFVDALPFLITAYDTIIERFKEECISIFGEKVGISLTKIVYEMCHPDPEMRGIPKLKGHDNRFQIRPYVGRLNTIVQLAQVHGVT